MASRSRELGRHLARNILCKLQLGPRLDFKFELLPLHSPLLGQSLLVSFTPLIDMLKYSGYTYLIRGQRRGARADLKKELPYLLGSTNPCPTAVRTEPCPTSVLEVFFFNDTATTEIYTLALRDVLPISRFQIWAVAASLAVTRAIPVGFFSSAY